MHIFVGCTVYVYLKEISKQDVYIPPGTKEDYTGTNTQQFNIYSYTAPTDMYVCTPLGKYSARER